MSTRIHTITNESNYLSVPIGGLEALPDALVFPDSESLAHALVDEFVAYVRPVVHVRPTRWYFDAAAAAGCSAKLIKAKLT